MKVIVEKKNGESVEYIAENVTKQNNKLVIVISNGVTYKFDLSEIDYRIEGGNISNESLILG